MNRIAWSVWSGLPGQFQPDFTIRVEIRFVEQSTEGKVSVEQNVRGVTIYANNKTTADKKGVTNTTSVGAKISVGSQNNKAEGYGEGFGSYTNRGSLSGGFKVGGDVINTKKSTTGNTTLKTESKTGGSVSAFWKKLTDF